MKQKATTERARELRRNQSNAERLFWSKVRNRQLAGWKFKRQVPLGPFIVDFYVDEAKAVIELDGDQHGRDDHPARDAARDEWLENNGYVVIRFWNNELYDNAEGVFDALLDRLEARRRELHPPQTPYE